MSGSAASSPGPSARTAMLRPFLPVDFAGDVDALWAAYEAGTPDPNPHSFVTWLFHEGHLASADVRAVLTSGHMVLTLSSGADSAVLRGDVPEVEPLGVIGRGAMGEVLVVRDRALRRTMAQKRTLVGSGMRHADRALFLNEAQITAQLDHPGIVPVYGFEGDPDGAMSYTMKLVHGRTLAAVIKEAKTQIERGDGPDEAHDLPARLDLFLHVCDAVAYAHEHGVVHRDLKPENIMVASFNEVTVMDWGIARAVPTERGTESLAVAGTPVYMSPEQAFGTPMALEPASDQYTLGLILHELVSLRFANPGVRPAECIVRAREGTVLPLTSPRGPVPRDLQAIVDRATARTPDGRYPSVGALAADVRRSLRNEETSVAPDQGIQRVQRWVSQHRERATTIGLLLVLLLLFVATGLSALAEARVASQKRDAAEREADLEHLAGISARQVQHIDAQLSEWESVLAGIAFAAELALTEPAPPSPPYFGVPGEPAPADLARSDFYGVGMSLTEIDLHLAEGVAGEPVREQMAQLKRLTPALRSGLLRGSSPDAYKEQASALSRLRTEGLRLVWTYVGTSAGIIATFPGTDGGYPPGYDHRTMSWYQIAVDQTGPVWNLLETDESGMGLLLTAAQALYDEDGAFLGVAALDVLFRYVVDALLDAPELADRSEAFLLDANKFVVARSTHKEDAQTMKDFTPLPFAHGVWIPGAGADRSGWAEFEVGGVPQLLRWTRLHAVPWTYVVIGPRDGLLEVARGQ